MPNSDVDQLRRDQRQDWESVVLQGGKSGIRRLKMVLIK